MHYRSNLSCHHRLQNNKKLEIPSGYVSYQTPYYIDMLLMEMQ